MDRSNGSQDLMRFMRYCFKCCDQIFSYLFNSWEITRNLSQWTTSWAV